MINPTANFTTRLPSLIAYIEALLDSLNTDATLQARTNTANDNNYDSLHTDRIAQLLWVGEDNAEMLSLKAQLTKNKAIEIAESEVFTLASLSKQNVPQRYQLACFWLPKLTNELLPQYIPLIMRYRDLYAAHLLIAVDDSIDLYAYGLTLFETTDNIQHHHSIALWEFNLYDYKKLPSWLNSDYWANPENWDKNRW